MSEMEPAYASRSTEFGNGLSDGVDPFGSPHLAAEAARYNASVPSAVQSTGSLNGMSVGQYEATFGGQYPVQNGISNDTYAMKKFRGGQNEE
jgi:hypothetical protein